MKPLTFAWRTLRRELRYGELVTLAAALVLAVAALSAVATLGQRVERSILASATELIGRAGPSRAGQRGVTDAGVVGGEAAY